MPRTAQRGRNGRSRARPGSFWTKYARRIFAIVSTTSIPNLAPVSPTEATVDPPSRGSRLDADHPENGVLIPCRFRHQTEIGHQLPGVGEAAEVADFRHNGDRNHQGDPAHRL